MRVIPFAAFVSLLVVACSTPPASVAAALPTCSLSAEELQARRQQLLPGLFQSAEATSDITDGLRLRFAPRAGLVSDLVRVIEQEQDCCSFLRFQLDISPNAGPITLDVSGPPGTREMLRAL